MYPRRHERRDRAIAANKNCANQAEVKGYARHFQHFPARILRTAMEATDLSALRRWPCNTVLIKSLSGFRTHSEPTAGKGWAVVTICPAKAENSVSSKGARDLYPEMLIQKGFPAAGESKQYADCATAGMNSWSAPGGM